MPSIQVNDIQMYYEMRGEGEPLVLILGLANRHLRGWGDHRLACAKIPSIGVRQSRRRSHR